MADVDPNVVSVSTIFSPGNREGGANPDTVLSSTDGVLFYISIPAIRTRAPTAFATIVPLAPNTQPSSSASTPGVITTSCDSITLTIVLQALYGLSSASIAPTVDAIDRALDSMLPNGIDPKAVLHPNSSLYGLLSSQIPQEPMKVYAIAAQHSLEDLACRASSHLLGYDLRNIDDNLAQKMGPLYLKRLFGLFEERMKELNGIIIQPPGLHPPTATCSTEKQRSLRTEWGLCIVRVLQEAKPSISPFALGRSFEYGIMNVECHDCRKTWSDRTNEISRKWAAVKYTI
ncbi:hypothetical protein BKA70DRAFT_1263957 [Coprinopsis sp. MPI-PUGE-AT-0042]|nr:hypothetical protein BKA70DRAFT_1263957 [Coprinopsis sp. MPI-PUGE-AT-0042]